MCSPYSTPELAHYCFIASYAYALLTEGYHFEPSRNLTVMAKIDGLKVSWALGAMLYEINALPWEYVKTYTWLHAFIGSFFINMLLLAGVIFFLIQNNRSVLALRRHRASSTPTMYPSYNGYGRSPSLVHDRSHLLEGGAGQRGA